MSQDIPDYRKRGKIRPVRRSHGDDLTLAAVLEFDGSSAQDAAAMLEPARGPGLSPARGFASLTKGGAEAPLQHRFCRDKWMIAGMSHFAQHSSIHS
jgi:hypothetical protein